MKNQRLRSKDLHTGRIVYMVSGGKVEKLTVLVKGRTRFIEKKLGIPHGSMVELHRDRILLGRENSAPFMSDLCMCKGEAGLHLFAKEKHALRYAKHAIYQYNQMG